MADPSNIALFGHRSQLWLGNSNSGSQIAVDRVQSVEPSFTIPTQKYYELARKGPVGVTQAPPEYRVQLEQNMVNSYELDYLLAGMNLAPAGAQPYDMGDVLSQSGFLKANVLNLSNTDTIVNEHEIDGCSVAEVTYRFTVGQALMMGVSLIGKSGRLWQAGTGPHGSAFGALDNASYGGIDGKDARVWFSSGSGASDRAFRLQQFTIRCAFPVQYVRELGRRDNVGTLSDPVDVTAEFDVLLADDQPTNVWFTDMGDYLDYSQPVTIPTTIIRVFDPVLAEGTHVLRSFKLENLRLNSHTPIRAAVRQLATQRYSATVASETTTDSGGLIVSNRNQ